MPSKSYRTKHLLECSQHEFVQGYTQTYLLLKQAKKGETEEQTGEKRFCAISLFGNTYFFIFSTYILLVSDTQKLPVQM